MKKTKAQKLDSEEHPTLILFLGSTDSRFTILDFRD